MTLDRIHENNPFMTVILGDCNAKFNNQRKTDITSLEGFKIDTIASSYGLNQLIQEPTHVINSSSSCTDLIFNLQPNLVMVSGIHSSLDSNCHQHIVLLSSICIFPILRFTKELSGIMKERILNLSEELLISLTG